MNIFLTSFNPSVAAAHLDDLRLNKMILETAQLLSNAYRILFGDHQSLYKKTHSKHPCSLWACKHIDNYSWLVEYFNALAQEKYKRDTAANKRPEPKFHMSWVQLFEIFNAKCKPNCPTPTFDFNCTDFKTLEVRQAYQKQLNKKWENDLRPPTWTGSQRPIFDL